MAVGKNKVIIGLYSLQTYSNTLYSHSPREVQVTSVAPLMHSLRRVRIYLVSYPPLLTKHPEWYDLKAPSVFETRNIGKTVVNRSAGLKNADDSLKGRVVELSLGDLNKDEDQAFRKMKLKVDSIQGKNCLTSFYGMDMTSDKLRSLVRKWQSLIESHVDVRTTDGYLVRLFAIAFTKRRPQQVKKTTYAKSSQIREIRKKMFEIMTREAGSCDLKQLVQKFVPEAIGREIEKATRNIYPLQNVFIRKAKILKSPKFELGKLLEQHGGVQAATEDAGVKVAKGTDFVEPAPLTSV